MSRLYAVLGWGVVALGTVHMLTTFMLRDGSGPSRVWFFGAGIGMVLLGAVNLLNGAYGAAAIGVRRVCIGANALMTCFAIVAGVVTGAGPGEFVVVLALVGGTAVLSLVMAGRTRV